MVVLVLDANIGLTLDGNGSIIRSRANHHYFGAFPTTTVDNDTVPTDNYIKIIADDDATRQVIQSAGDMWFSVDTAVSAQTVMQLSTFSSAPTTDFLAADGTTVGHIRPLSNTEIHVSGGDGKDLRLSGTNILMYSTTDIDIGNSLSQDNVNIGAQSGASGTPINLFGPTKFHNMTTTDRNNLTGLTGGEVIFNTTDSKLQVYDGTTWVNLH